MTTEVRDLSTCWFQAWLDKDPATVERLAAPDYVYVSPNGVVLDRQAILAVIRSQSYRLDWGRRTEVILRALGTEAVLVRHHYEGGGTFEGVAFTDDQRSVMVWEKHSGGWHLVMEQCAVIGK